MKYLILLLLLMLAAAPLMARAEDFTNENKGLPVVFKRGADLTTYFCAVAKVSHADARISPYIGSQLSLDDIGSYVVLYESHIALAGESSERILGGKAMSYTEAVQQLGTNDKCGANVKDAADEEWRAELDKRFTQQGHT